MIPEFKPYIGDIAKNYEARRIHTNKWNIEQDAVEMFLTMSSGVVLDIPVGTGRFGDACRSIGRPLFGMDVSDDMMEIARARGIECRYGDARKIPLPDKSVDTVICLRLFYWMSEAEQRSALSEFARVSRGDLILGMSRDQSSPAGWNEHDCVVTSAHTRVFRLSK